MVRQHRLQGRRHALALLGVGEEGHKSTDYVPLPVWMLMLAPWGGLGQAAISGLYCRSTSPAPYMAAP